MSNPHDLAIDDAIRDDAAALTAETARARGDFAELRERLLGGGTPYRDSHLAIEQRRQAVLEERRIDLALLPLRLQRVYVHRVARIAAGCVAALCGLALWAQVALPAVFRVRIDIHPRFTLDLALFGAVAAVLLAYVLGIVTGERLLQRALRRSVMPSRDALADVEREGPVAETRRLAWRVDPFVVALPLVGAALVVPLLVFVSLLYLDGIRKVYTRLLYLTDANGVLARNIVYLAVAVAVAVALAIGVARGCRRDRSLLVRAFGHWGVVAASIVVGLLVLIVGGRSLFLLHVQHVAPAIAERWFLAVGGVLAFFGPCVWGILALRRREQRLLERDTLPDDSHASHR
jgi:hypothetical protein